MLQSTLLTRNTVYAIMTVESKYESIILSKKLKKVGGDMNTRIRMAIISAVILAAVGVVGGSALWLTVYESYEVSIPRANIIENLAPGARFCKVSREMAPLNHMIDVVTIEAFLKKAEAAKCIYFARIPALSHDEDTLYFVLDDENTDGLFFAGFRYTDRGPEIDESFISLVRADEKTRTFLYDNSFWITLGMLVIALGLGGVWFASYKLLLPTPIAKLKPHASSSGK